MTTGLHLLVVEDVPDEAELMVRHLSQAGLTLDWTRVETEAEYLTALGTLPDLILADWRLPHFSGLRALELMRERGLDIPFVIVSGSIGEEAAVDAMRQGAYDYVLKDRPARLGQAVEHALSDKQQREDRRQAEAALRESEERYRTLFNEMPAGIYRTSIDGRMLEANPALAALFGYDSPDDLIGTNVRDLYAEPERRLQWSESVARNGVLRDAEIRVRRKDGLLIWARDSGRTVRDQSGRPIYFDGTLSDITERKHAEAETLRANRLYALISQINQATVRAKDRHELFTEACRIAVEYGTFRMAWVGLVDAAAQTVRPVAWAGAEDGYLTSIKKILLRDVPEGRGPTGTAIREGRSVASNDIADDARMVPWREEALKRGYRASLAIPIRVGGSVIGAFNLYAAEPYVFSESEVGLLEQVTGDLAYALEMIEGQEQRQRAEEALRESEARYRLLAENMADTVWLMDMDLRVTYISPSVTRVRGFTLEETNAIPLEQQVTPESFARATQLLSQALSRDAPGAPATMELEFFRKDGTSYWSETSFVMIRAADGAPQAILGVGRDVTERKRAEQALRESEEKYRNLVERANDGILIVQDGTVKFVNSRLAEMGGGTVDETLGTPFTDYVHPDDLPLVMDRYRRRMAGEAVSPIYELALMHRDGSKVPAEINAGIISYGGKPADLVIARDISERRRSEAALRESESKLREAQALGKVGSWEYDPARQMITWSDGAFALYERDPALGPPTVEEEAAYYTPEQAKALREYTRRALEEGQSAEYDFQAVLPSGRHVDYAGRMQPLKDAHGRVTKVFGTVQDITERKAAERTLRESEANYRTIFEGIQDAIMVQGPNGEYLDVNRRACEMYGYTRQEFLGKTVHDLLPPGSEPLPIETLVRSSQEGHLSESLERRADGTVFPVQLSASIQTLSGDPRALIVARDITDAKRAEKALQHRVAELEALYQISLQSLAGGDLQSLLVAIVQRAARLTGGDRGGLYMPTADGSHIRLHISFNLGRDYTGTELALGEGASGQSALERRAIMIEDYSAWTGKSGKFRDAGIGRVLAVPMLVGDRLAGVLNVADPKTGSYGEDEIRLVSLFADQAAMAIESARLLDETRTRAAYLEALTGTAGTLRSAVTPQEIYAKVLDQVVAQLNVEGATLEVQESADREIEVVLAVGAWQARTGTRQPAGAGIVGAVISSGRPIVSEDVRGDPRLARLDLFQDLPAMACVPLTVDDRAIGAMLVGRHTPLNAEDVRLLTGLAEIAGTAIHRARVMATLEMRVHQRTRELEAANERLQELDRLKTDFVSNVTHELRTPITNIVLYLDLARRTESEVKRSHYFNVLGSESVRLGGLIEEVLTLSRLERGAVPMDREPYPLDSLLADVCVAHQVRADTKGVRLKHELDPSLPVASINRSQIHQVLTNLVANAVAYTPPGGQVHLGTARSEVGGLEYVGMVVHNTGTVIAAEDQAHLFDRFYRGRIGRASGEPGTGLGLAISKEIVELHHGWIDVESTEQGGTTFTVWLPMEAPAG